MTPDQLKKILPLCDAAVFAPIITRCFADYGISSGLDQASFLGSIGAETGGLTQFSENLRYSAAQLLKQWPNRYTPELAARHAGNSQLIAEHVYGGRFGNGPEGSGDGYNFRGGGAIQLTFRGNYEPAAKRFAMPVEQFAAWIRTPEGAIRSAGDFWRANKISARAADFDGQCDLVNIGKKTIVAGDAIGYAKRLAIRNLALQVL